MGRNAWRRMTSYKGSRKRKLLEQSMGEGFGKLESGERDGMAITENDANHDVTPVDVQEAKRSKADGVEAVEMMTAKILGSSKDVIARDNIGNEKDISETEKCDTKNLPSYRNALPEISLSNLKPVKSGSVLSGIPLPAAASATESRPGAIFIFEKASLVLAKINKSYQIINPDEHAGFMKKHNLNRSDYRPDIIHEVLARLLGSRLNLSGGIQAVYVKTIEGHLIKIEPTLSVPKTLKSFCAMMAQLFQNLNIKATGRSKCRRLLHMIQNPVTAHLPVGSHKIGLSSTSNKAVNLWEYFDTIGSDQPLVFVIGAMAHGKIDSGYTDDFIAVSALPLSANLCVRRICNALEKQRRIL